MHPTYFLEQLHRGVWTRLNTATNPEGWRRMLAHKRDLEDSYLGLAVLEVRGHGDPVPVRRGVVRPRGGA